MVLSIAPAIWNFKERNFLKSITLNLISKILPNLSFSGKGFINVQASDNLKNVEKLSKDPSFHPHEPKLKSLNGVTHLMDKAFEDTKLSKKSILQYINISSCEWIKLYLRKPLIEILQNQRLTKILEKILI